ncbi:MAG TPA: ribosomal protein S18-alanine N-acetyltransferase [Firmicutes bacterium]|nr:ribosomal protein S18-alanine N-acetyltransferase [Bacillota bacterium]
MDKAMITLEKMNMTHLEEVLALERLCFSNPWSYEAYRFELEDNQLADYLVVLDAGRVVGYGGMWLIMDEAHVTNIAIHPQYRRRGLGELLLRCLMTRAYVRGARRMTLEVRRSNHIAQRLYEKLGFRGIGYRKDYYSDNGEDALIMWKEDLQPAGTGQGQDQEQEPGRGE